MKSILISIALMLGLMNFPSNNFDFDKAWVEVELLIKERLPKSAIEKVEVILTAAKTENIINQEIKALKYITKLTLEIEEEGVEKVIDRLAQELSKAEGTSKAILQSYLAEIYQNYFDQNRWTINSRTNIAGGSTNEDIRTWTSEDFFTKVASLYLSSIDNPKLTEISINELDNLLVNQGVTNEELRPTLYLLLADRCLQYFRNNQGSQFIPINSFLLDKEVYLSDYDSFINTELSSYDTSSYDFKTLVLFQNVIANCKNSNFSTALMEYDLQRLEWVWQNAIFENKDELYFTSLTSLKEQYSKNDFAAQVGYKMAEYQQQKDTSLNALAAIVSDCDIIIKTYPNTIGAQNCTALKNQILNKQLNISLDEVNPSTTGIICEVTYKNINGLFYRILHQDDVVFDNRNGSKEAVFAALNNAKPFRTGTHGLGEKGKHKEQKGELILEPLPIGSYYIFSSPNEDFSQNFTYNAFQVSNLSMVTFDSDDMKYFMVTDRITGQPLYNVKAEIRTYQYDRNLGIEKSNLFATKYTDKNGQFYIQKSENNNINISVKLTYKDDIYDEDNRFYIGRNRYGNGRNIAEIYTDRAIYRPGQIVYFKAIAMAFDEENIPSILAKEALQVKLIDANHQDVAALDLITNDFGSVSGSFILPSSGLTGQFSIRIQGNALRTSKSIKVEEYKRPKFKVEIANPDGQFIVGDTVSVKVNAQNYAGVALDNASFNYKITRNAHYPYWPWYRSYYPNTNTAIIKRGVGTLDEKGEYSIAFEATPDFSQKKENDPTFIYTIEVDVTDINGETQSGQHTVNVAYKAFSLTSNISGNKDKSELDTLVLSAYNSVRNKLNTSGTYKIEKLKEPEHVQLFRKNTGIPLINNNIQVQKIIPNYQPLFDANYSTWPIEKMILSTSFDTESNLFSNWASISAGVYKITAASIDSFGNNILLEEYFVISDFNKSAFPKSDYLFFKTDKEKYVPGDNLVLNLGAAEPNSQVYIMQGKQRGAVLHGWKILNNTNSFNYKITESDLGGTGFSLMLVKDNKIITKQLSVLVPWEEKQLKISLETVRDKVEPGSEEDWRIKIAGPNADQVMAEVLASMYDSSLDAIVKDSWRNAFFPSRVNFPYIQSFGYGQSWALNYFTGLNSSFNSYTIPMLEGIPIDYYSNRRDYYRRGAPMMDGVMMKSMAVESMNAAPAPAGMAEETSMADMETDESVNNESTEIKEESTISIRKNLNETVFFYPHLMTDKDGNIILKFKMNEALTEWKLRVMAHTPLLATAFEEKKIVTQKDLMVFPNLPRFLREFDEINISTKIANLAKEDITGQARVSIFDAVTDEDITDLFISSEQNVPFNIVNGGSTTATWQMKVPSFKGAVKYRITAATAKHSDGEESILPVVTNRMLVTETMPLHVSGKSSKHKVFEAMANNKSTTKENHKYTIEVNSHPVWYAIQSLPYLMEYPYECTEQILNKYYANALASKIANTNPKIKAVFDDWRKNGESLKSNLSKNQDLKNAILEETPWVLDAQNEAVQKQNIALLFDLNKMASEQDIAIKKLQERQYPSGGFPWFNGGRESEYITQYVVENLGHLKKMGVLENNEIADQILQKAIVFIDNSLTERYEKLLKNIKKSGGDINANHLDRYSIHYLYARSFFNDKELDKNNIAAYNYYVGQAKTYWKPQGLYTTGMIGIALNRLNEQKVAANILESVKQRSFYNEELGRYWNEGNGYRWDQLPIERHSLMIEFFVEMKTVKNYIDDLKLWLLNNKQTNRWETTKATSAAIYALLIDGEKEGISNWINETKLVEVSLNKKRLDADNIEKEAGTGYYKKSYEKADFNNKDAEISVTNPNESVAWVSAYYQYFEDLDKIKAVADMPLSIMKKYYKNVATDKGNELIEISDTTALKLGDKVVVRLIVKSDREMEYIHLKDMRPSGLEPVDVLSQYRWKDGLGYYENTKDLATHYFIDHMPKGTYVLEYTTKVNNTGIFSSGIATIQCMYAPEFSSHSEGLRIVAK
jgi:uncharacterized protein YfaS (alpha-2-macroglobulin family)